LIPLFGTLVLLFFVWLYLAPRANHPTGAQPAPTPVSLSTTGTADGAEIFERMCDRCHGLEGQTYGPRLSVPSNVSDQALAMLILKGIPGTIMPSHEGQLTDQELAALVKFLKANILPKSRADEKALEIGPNAQTTSMDLVLVQISDEDLLARATLKDAGGAPLANKPVVFYRVSSLNGRLPLATVTTNAQGLATFDYESKPGETIQLESAFEGEKGRQASTAAAQTVERGGQPIEPLATGLVSASPPVGLLAILATIAGGIWMVYGYVLSLILKVATAKIPPRSPFGPGSA
jgi:mono/diheme cytochrome c family protein